MKSTSKTLAATAGLIGLAALPAAAQRPNPAVGLQVTSVNPDAAGAQTLVNALLGPGVTVVGTPTIVGNVDQGGAQQGTFTTSGPDVFSGGFKNGIILTNGYASNTIGPDSHSINTGDEEPQGNKSWGSVGDSSLSGLISGTPTNDADVLTFNFTVAPTTKDLAFTYVYGTNEYPDYTTGFTDPFGFFVDGKNIALIPGTKNNVTVQTITNPANSAYFIDNLTAGVNAGYNALSVPLLADVTSALDPTLTVHTIKLAVADSSDTLVDTGVYIQGGSFTQGGKPPPPAVPEPSSFAMLGLGMSGLILVARKRRRA